MNLLYLTFYFGPDLGPGAFRNSALVDELGRQLPKGSHIHVITTQPNRYQSYKPLAAEREEWMNESCQITIDRVTVPAHKGGQLDQIRAFMVYFWAVYQLTKLGSYTSVFASSSRLFTAFMGAGLARVRRIPLYLDIRDLFREAILDVHKSRSYTGFLVYGLLNVPLRFAEWFTFAYANNINLVSEGFRSYFKKYKKATYSYFTNGIDDQFINFVLSPHQAEPLADAEKLPEEKIILYAGNVGEGQGLHKIIPYAAQQLGPQYRFVIIGGGGAKPTLEAALRIQEITNVELHEPVSRSELMTYYQRADYLFLHLNNLEACQRVLPSKLFEYGAVGKPILAGVTGFAAQFMREHLPGTILFEPGDVMALVKQLRQKPYHIEDRTEFKIRFRRSTISQQMAQHIRQNLSGYFSLAGKSDRSLVINHEITSTFMK